MERERKPSKGELFIPRHLQRQNEIRQQPAKVGCGLAEGVLLKNKDGKFMFRLGSGAEKPVMLTEPMDLEAYVGRTAKADMQNFVIVGFPSGFDPPEPTTHVSEEAIEHSFDRHTLRGIFRLGKIESTNKGDDIALFDLDITYGQMKQQIMKAHGEKLKWEHRTCDQSESFYRGMKFIGQHFEDKVEVSTAFPTALTRSRKLIEGCLAEDRKDPFKSFEDFLRFFVKAYQKRYFD